MKRYMKRATGLVITLCMVVMVLSGVAVAAPAVTDPVNLLLASMQVAGSYEMLAGNLDQCTELVLVLEGNADAEPVYIASAEDANTYVTLMQEALEGAANGEE